MLNRLALAGAVYGLAPNPASRWGQACRRITRGRRNRSSALGKLFVQVGLRVRILLPPAVSQVRTAIGPLELCFSIAAGPHHKLSARSLVRT
jgi:hypothetical protein